MQSDHTYENSGLTTRPGAIIGAAAIVGLLFMIGVFILVIMDSSQLGGKLFLGAAIGSISIPLMLIYLIARIYADSEKLTYRNALGFKTSILWKDVKAVYTASHMGDIKVCSEKCEIKIYTYFKDSDLLEDLARKFCPKAFNIDSWIDSPVIPKGYRKKNGPLIFGLRRFLAPVFLTSLAGLVLGAFYTAVKAPFALGIFFLIISANVIILLNCIMMRVSFDSEYVHFRNAIGMKKSILWKDIIICEVYTESGTEYIKLSSHYDDIKISQNFSGYQLIGKIINRYSPYKPRRRKNKK